MKIIYRSLLKKLNKPQLIRGRPAVNPAAKFDLMKEVAILKKMNHPNIVRLYEVIDDPTSDKFFMCKIFLFFSFIYNKLVLEYVEQGAVLKITANNTSNKPPYSETLVRKYAKELIAGLDYCMLFYRLLILM